MFNCCLLLCTTPACFSTFYWFTIIPILVENSFLKVKNKVKSCILHWKEDMYCNGGTHPSYINNCLKVKYPLRLFVRNVQPVTQQYKSNCSESTSVITEKNRWCCMPLLYQLLSKSKVPITSSVQPVTQLYKLSTFVVKVATMKNTVAGSH